MTVAQKEEAPEMTVTTQEEVAPQVNGEKVEKESPDANDISAVEETAGEEKPDNATEVGFKKIFRFVGFKFTLKKDKGEEKEPVKLLTIKDKDGVEENGTDEPKKEEDTVSAEDKSTEEEKMADTEASTVEAVPEDKPENVETTDAPPEAAAAAAEKTDEEVKEDDVTKEGEANQDVTMTLSPLKKLFSTGLFSNLRKKSSVKKTKDEEGKEAAAEETTAAAEETPAEVQDEQDVTVEEKENVTGEKTKEEAVTTPEVEKCESKEEAPASPTEPEPNVTAVPEPTPETEAPAETTSDDPKQEEEKAEGSHAEEKTTTEVTPEPEIISSQEKAKPQGSPLKKLFTGAGLKKLSTKKQKAKKDTESKLTESGEQTAEQLQSSSESTEAPKTESGPSSPEDSGEHAIDVEVTQNGSSQEADAEVTSDGEKKKDGIIAWSSFKRLVTPKKLVKRSSDSEDETTGEKPAKSATLSSSESAALTDTTLEEAKEEDSKEGRLPEEELKNENTEKLVSSTEEPKKKIDTSVSWEALMCMGGTKKRARKTSDSDDEDTKVEEEAAAPAAGTETAVEELEETKTEAAVPPENTENEEVNNEVVSAPEPVTSPPERESAWDTLKRFVLSKNKPKVEEKPGENATQSQSESEAPKEESSFSLRKFLPGRRKKKVEKQTSVETAEEDSDTPAVVPLSEYDDQVVAQQEAPAEPAVGQVKAAEERSPSWIATTIQDAGNQHDQLSDIPEEAENTATPKSIDTDIVEDEILDDATTSPKHLGGMGRRLSTAEVASVAPAQDAQATLVPEEPTSHCATEVVQNLEIHVSEISPQTSVTVENVPVQAASADIEFEPPTETAESKTNTILQVHAREEAVAICTGLGTKEIAKMSLEKPASPVVEVMAVVRDPVSINVAVEDKPASEEQAVIAEDSVFKAQVLQVDTTDLEGAVDSSPEGVLDVQAATEGHEPEMEKTGLITTALDDSVVLQSATVAVNSPKVEVVNPITPTSETAVCTQSVQVTEPNIETKELAMEEENVGAALEENTPVTELAQVVTRETSSTTCETALTTMTKETEPNICLVLPSEEVPVITETVVLSSLSVGSDQVELAVENASLLQTVVDEITEIDKGEDMSVEIPAVQTLEVSQMIKEEMQQACESEVQGMAIAQAVIQDAVEKFSKDMPEPKKPSTTSADIPTPVQADAKIEKEIEISAEIPVITDTPSTAVCEGPQLQSLHVAMQVVDTVAIEVTESLDAPKEEEEKVVESQTGEESSQVKKEECEEEEKLLAEEVKEKDEDESETKKPTPVVLQIAQVVEEASVEEEAVVEFDTNGPVDDKTSQKEERPESENNLSTLTEEPTEVSSASQVTVTTEESQPETTSKCAEVMAQVIDVIEEAVKEIEPVSTEITATS